MKYKYKKIKKNTKPSFTLDEKILVHEENKMKMTKFQHFFDDETVP